MSARFIALPVTWGDAFYLESELGTFLVDGGLDETALPTLLRTHAQPDRAHPRIDVAICTHNDADHALGLLGLLRDPNAHIGEMWLPGTFREVLHRVAGVGVAGAVASVLFGPRSRPDITEPAPDPSFRAEPGRDANEDPLSLDDDGLDLLLDEWRRRRGFWCAGVIPNLSSSTAPHGWPSPQALVEALRNILDLAEACQHAGVRVRWLELSDIGPHFQHRGMQALRAIDARIAARRRAFFPDVLRLTMVNRNALTFLATVPHAETVLFSSDAGRQFPTTAPPGVGIITAPHHGSSDPENVAAYASFASAPTAVMVRSDGQGRRTRGRPCPTYLTWPRRYCTHCRQGPAQAISLQPDASGRWAALPGVNPCRC